MGYWIPDNLCEKALQFRRNLAQKGLVAIEEQLGTKRYQLQSDSQAFGM
jgi:hypothetical protein